MPIAFYYLSGSPFSWKVWLALECKHLDYELHVLSADAGDLKKPQFTAINPRSKVPAITDDGFVLYESDAIIEYLEDKYPHSGGRLWPQNVHARALARRIVCEAGAYVYPQTRKLVLELLMRCEGEPNAAILAEAMDALALEFANLGQTIAGPFIAGSEPTAADFALYPLAAIIGRIDRRLPEYNVAEVIPGLVGQWMKHVEALPYFSKTLPPHWRQP